MTLFEAALLGTIQGITEFLPVSSSGHLVIVQSVMGIGEGALTFDAVIHFGSLVAIMWVFRSELTLILRGLTGSASEEARTGRKLLLLLVIATLPLVAIGLLLRDLVDQAFATIWVTPIMLYLTGAFLLLAERFPGGKTGGEAQVSWRQALGIGLAQVLAVLPGMSRSGITIVAGMMAGLSRDLAARFSFLMAIPAISGAAILELRHALDPTTPSVAGPAALLVGTLAAGISTYYAVVLFLRFVKRGKLTPFAYYTWALATVVLFFAFTGRIGT
jgi:undecaprenyl-diphosphatase